jgi:hypothetical protein
LKPAQSILMGGHRRLAHGHNRHITALAFFQTTANLPVAVD